MKRLCLLLALLLVSALAVPAALADEELQVGDYYFGSETYTAPYGGSYGASPLGALLGGAPQQQQQP